MTEAGQVAAEGASGRSDRMVGEQPAGLPRPILVCRGVVLGRRDAALRQAARSGVFETYDWGVHDGGRKSACSGRVPAGRGSATRPCSTWFAVAS